MSELGFRPFDADNHYYEATDAFTRHIDPAMAKRGMQWADVDGKRRLLVGGKINKFIPNPTFDPIARPGSLEDYFRGRNDDGLDLKTMFGELEPIAHHPGYRERDARLALLDEQGMDGALLFPTLGVGMQEALARDVPALHAAFTAFNRWLDDDWGFDRGDGRLYAAPMITFADPERAAAEVRRVLDAGARILVAIPGPVPDGEGGYVSPGHPCFDPVWGLIAEAGVPLALHAGLSGVGHYGRFWRTGAAEGGGGFTAFRHAAFPLVAFQDRGISDTLAAIICHGVLDRFPALRLASIENGAMWVPDLLRNLGDARGKMPFAFGAHPVDQFVEHVWVAPYYEDDMAMLKDVLGVDRLLFGSDFPHTEGLPEPTAFVKDIPTFTPDETRKVMRDNVLALLGVSIAIGEDRLALQAAVRRFAADRCPPAVARAALEAEVESLPPFWDELAGLGWLGEGAGFAELAVVLEELGRVVAPGPMLPSAWATGVLAFWRPSALMGHLRDARTGGVALGGSVHADGTSLSGTTGPVLGGGLADVGVVPDADDRWWLVDTADPAVTVTPLDSLDPTRRLARLDLAGAPATPLPGVTRARVEQVGVTLAAAECAGGAAWCVDTAAAYARDRQQFGRPIGQFQAVKHRCADMLGRLEEARAVAWDAAAALDADPDDPTAALAVAAAGAVALEAYATVAKDCIQVLGGIGFTWEHDAHLHLRRALSLRQLFGGARPWRRAAAAAAVAGVRRHLVLDLPAEADAVRAEVRAAAEAIAALPREDRRARLADTGLLVPHWDPPWGRGAGPAEQLVIDQELRRAKVRVPHLNVGAWAAPTIAVHGTPDQQDRWVGPTLRGEIAWCQLFSEPGAGSDLAALTTRAVRTEGGWLLTGQKVWTSMAAEAAWGICLARTNPRAPKHLGITYFVLDMATPGIDIRPLREITGLAMFNEVFLDDVFVPDDGVVGEVDGGWPLARTTLANERVSMGSGSSFGGGLEALLALVADRPEVLDHVVLDGLGAVVAEAHALAAIGLRATARSLTGAAPGPEASVRKLLGVEHDQRTQELGLALLGAEGATTEGPAAQWTFGFLANRCLTIAGGTSEIQRNVIGERLLGLPRDPEPLPG